MLTRNDEGWVRELIHHFLFNVTLKIFLCNPKQFHVSFFNKYKHIEYCDSSFCCYRSQVLSMASVCVGIVAAQETGQARRVAVQRVLMAV